MYMHIRLVYIRMQLHKAENYTIAETHDYIRFLKLKRSKRHQ